MSHSITRRQSLKLIGVTLAALALPSVSVSANRGGQRKALPLIGLAPGVPSMLAAIQKYSVPGPRW